MHLDVALFLFYLQTIIRQFTNKYKIQFELKATNGFILKHFNQENVIKTKTVTRVKDNKKK